MWELQWKCLFLSPLWRIGKEGWKQADMVCKKRNHTERTDRNQQKHLFYIHGDKCLNADTTLLWRLHQSSKSVEIWQHNSFGNREGLLQSALLILPVPYTDTSRWKAALVWNLGKRNSWKNLLGTKMIFTEGSTWALGKKVSCCEHLHCHSRYEYYRRGLAGAHTISCAHHQQSLWVSSSEVELAREQTQISQWGLGHCTVNLLLLTEHQLMS